MKTIFIVGVTLFIWGCSENKLKIVEVKFNPTASLILMDKLEFKNTDSLFIGEVNDVEIFNNHIYISDKTNNKIHVFNLRLQYIKSSKGKGHGPGEFPTKPYLSHSSNNLVVCCIGRGLSYLDTNFYEIKNINLTKGYVTDFIAKPVIHNQIIIASAFSEIPVKKSKISNITTAVIFDTSGSFQKGICKYDKIYDDNIGIAYYENKRYSRVINGFNNTVFVFQMATTNYHQFSLTGEYIQTISYKPKYYNEPPDITINKVRSLPREKAYENYLSRITNFKGFQFDTQNELLYVNYFTMKKEMLKSRSFLDADNYLFAINKNNVCVLDQSIDGYMVGVYDGYIYILSEESVEKITIKKYKIEYKE